MDCPIALRHQRLQRQPAQLARLIAEHGLGARINLRDTAVRIDDDDAVGRRLEQLAMKRAQKRGSSINRVVGRRL